MLVTSVVSMKKPSTKTRWIGRASSVACMPTTFMSGGSVAPIENSPPGIQTIPGGAGAGGGIGFAIVAVKLAAGVIVDGTDGAAVLRFLMENAQPATISGTATISRLRHPTDGLTAAGCARDFLREAIGEATALPSAVVL